MGVAANPAHAQFSEAPELAALVQEGKLPAVADRLPARPEVVTPFGSIGSYGGTMRQALRGNADHNAILRAIGAQGLTRWTMDFNGVVPNVAESWTTSPDAKEFTFKLRAGTKWSDGQPFTVDDVLFAAEDLLGNKEFFESAPARYRAGGEYMKITKVDDYTFTVAFAAPYRTFLEELATPLGQHLVLYAKHYCQQFHPKYNPDVQKLMAENNADTWATLMRQKCGDIELPSRWGNPARPTLDPWVITQPYSGGATQVVLERNPFFWQVDTKGQQLPYINSITWSVISEVEAILLATINGQIDYQVRHITPISNMPVLQENAAKGGYAVFNMQPLDSTAAALYLNQTSPDPVIRDLIRQKDFRVALSLAMDRDEINDIVHLGQGEPWQVGPVPENRLYNERMGRQFTERDVAQANALLDGLGLTQRDSEGFRLRPDGKRLSLNTIVSIQLTVMVETAELVRKQWQEIGVDMIINSSERSLFYERGQNNEYDITIDNGPGGLNPTQDNRMYVAVHPLDSRQSIPWVRWYQSGGAQGEEPSDSMKKRYELLDAWKIAPPTPKLMRYLSKSLKSRQMSWRFWAPSRPHRRLAFAMPKWRM